MTKYDIILYSKDKDSLESFLKFLKHSLKIQNIQKPFNYLKNKKNKKKITILKSPHVNKTAQEQFEYTIYSIKICFYSYRIKKYLVLIKKIKNQLFPDIKIKINVKSSVENIKNLIKKSLLNPNNFTFNLSKFNSINQRLAFEKLKNCNIDIKNASLLQKTAHYLKLLNWYGISFV